MNYDLFNQFYDEHRFKLNPSGRQSTRNNIRKFGELFPSDFNVIETNVNAFPTKKAKQLFDGSVDFPVLKKGWMIFKTILNKFRPNVIVAHGKDTSTYLSLLVHLTPEWNLEKVRVQELQVSGIESTHHQSSIIIPSSHFRGISHNEREELHTLIKSIYHRYSIDRELMYLKAVWTLFF
ncbi:hypothetical protein ACOALA_08610 [Alicyclobacillus acidoterrestris]|uniref:hypothetical protein n=1 Tax=Alicyclobacillus acidoterrestris TaxID=1450 RepID=UPI003F52985D